MSILLNSSYNWQHVSMGIGRLPHALSSFHGMTWGASHDKIVEISGFNYLPKVKGKSVGVQNWNHDFSVIS